MAAASPERLRDDLVRLVHRGAGVRDFSLGAARILVARCRSTACAWSRWTRRRSLPTGEVVENGLPPAAIARMAEIEVRGAGRQHVRRAGALGRRRGELSEATGGDLDRSVRHRELRRPTASATSCGPRWSATRRPGAGSRCCAATIGRTSRPPTRRSSASLSRYLAEGLRRAMLLTALSRSAGRRRGRRSRGARARQLDHAGRRRRRDVARRAARGGPAALPPVVTAVASRARGIAAGRAATAPRPGASPHGVRDLAARARLDARRRRRRADRSDHRARPAARARAPDRGRVRPHRARAGRHAARRPGAADERDRRAPAHLAVDGAGPPQGDLREGRGGTRGELVARVFFEHYAPRLADDAPVASNGWFAAVTVAPQPRPPTQSA